MDSGSISMRKCHIVIPIARVAASIVVATT